MLCKLPLKVLIHFYTIINSVCQAINVTEKKPIEDGLCKISESIQSKISTASFIMLAKTFFMSADANQY